MATHFFYYSLAWRPDLATIMDPYGRSITPITIAMRRGLYLAIITDRYVGPLTPLTIALHRGINVAIITDIVEGPLLPLL
jgi:hypothetical protein